MSTKKKVFIVVGVVALVLILVLAGVLIWVTRGLNYKNLKIGKVDLSKVPDGTYKGSFSGGRFSNTVRVTVKNHKITNIKVVKDVQFNKASTTQKIFDEVIKAQSTQVDAVTGATVTSKVYLKSIQNALSGASQ